MAVGRRSADDRYLEALQAMHELLLALELGPARRRRRAQPQPTPAAMARRPR